MIQPKTNKKKLKKQRERIVMGFIHIVLAFGVIVLFFTAKSIFFPEISNQVTLQDTTQMPAMSGMSLTNYDKGLARKMMDKNNDGKCDTCGMPVEMCMDSGQLQCNMDSKSTIGVLESQHIHADWKVYVDGNFVDFTGKDHMTAMKSGSSASSFIHVDSGASAPEETGDILHMHATGVPLWIFFESIGLDLSKNMKAYVNGKPIEDYKNYVFSDLDKILITDGVGYLQEQLNSITDFAKNH